MARRRALCTGQRPHVPVTTRVISGPRPLQSPPSAFGATSMYTTEQYEGMLAETVTIRGHNGDAINVYYARPLGPGPFPGMVLLHHFPGWDEWYREATRKFAHHGYLAISPDLYHRLGHGAPEDMAAKARAEGGVPD